MVSRLNDVFTNETDWKLFKQQKEWLDSHNEPEGNGLLYWLNALQDAIVADHILEESKVFDHKEYRVEVRGVFHTTLTGRDKAHIDEQLEDFSIKLLDGKGDIESEGEWQADSIWEIRS